MNTKYRYYVAIGLGLFSGLMLLDLKVIVFVSLYVAIFLNIIHYSTKIFNKKMRAKSEVITINGLVESHAIVEILSPEYSLNRTQSKYDGAKYHYYDSIVFRSADGKIFKILVGLNCKREVLLDYTQSLEFSSPQYQAIESLSIQVVQFDDEYYCERDLFMKLKGIDI